LPSRGSAPTRRNSGAECATTEPTGATTAEITRHTSFGLASGPSIQGHAHPHSTKRNRMSVRSGEYSGRSYTIKNLARRSQSATGSEDHDSMERQEVRAYANVSSGRVDGERLIRAASRRECVRAVPNARRPVGRKPTNWRSPIRGRPGFVGLLRSHLMIIIRQFSSSKSADAISATHEINERPQLVRTRAANYAKAAHIDTACSDLRFTAVSAEPKSSRNDGARKFVSRHVESRQRVGSALRRPGAYFTISPCESRVGDLLCPDEQIASG